MNIQSTFLFQKNLLVMIAVLLIYLLDSSYFSEYVIFVILKEKENMQE